MKRLLVFALGALVFTGCRDALGPESSVPAQATPSSPPSTNQAEPRPGHYIVVLKPDVPDVGRAASRLTWNRRDVVEHTYQYAMRGFAAKLSKAQADSLRADPAVASVEPDMIVRAMAVQRPAPSWGLDRIDARDLPLDDAYSYGATGAGVSVYIIDTGIRFTHQEFGGRAKLGHDALGGSGADCNGHGTHVAATVGGRTFGVAKSASIYSVRVLHCDGSAPLSSIIAGIDWVTAHHRSPAVANLSLGASYAPLLDSVVKTSINSGVTFVAAAGNDGADACNMSPARVSQVITVGASDRSDNRISWSNRGSCVDIFAPGERITSADYFSDVSTAMMRGTSMAAPHVSGVAALYLERNPGAKPAQVRDAILANATTGRLKDVAGSPNRLLYSGFVSGSTASQPTSPPADGPGGTSPSSGSEPVASYTYSCSANGTCTFDASGSTARDGILAYSWYFGDGTQAGGAKVQKYFSKAGSFEVRLKIADNKLRTASVTKTINIGSGSSESPTSPPPTSSSGMHYSCKSNRVCTFDASSFLAEGATVFSWYFGDGTQAGGVLIREKYYSAPGTYKVTLVTWKPNGQTTRTVEEVRVS